MLVPGAIPPPEPHICVVQRQLERVVNPFVAAAAGCAFAADYNDPSAGETDVGVRCLVEDLDGNVGYSFEEKAMRIGSYDAEVVS